MMKNGGGKGKNNEQVDNLQPTFEFHTRAGFVEKTFHNLATLSILPYPSRMPICTRFSDA